MVPGKRGKKFWELLINILSIYYEYNKQYIVNIINNRL